MRRHAIGIAVSFLVGAFAASQGCGGSTSDTEIPSGALPSTGSSAGGSTSTGGMSGSSGQGASGAKSGSGGAIGKAGASAGGASGSTTGGHAGATGGTTSGVSAGAMGLDGGMMPDGTDLFDVNVPDQSIPGSDGATVSGCYACLKSDCSQELQACEADPQCEQAATCIFQDCLGSGTQVVCTFGCIQMAGIDPKSPAAMEAVAIGQCGQSKCQTDCGLPASGTGGAGGTGGSGTGGTSSGGTSGSAGTGASAGSTGATCNYGSCGQVCQSQAFACYGDSLCKTCFQTQGQTAGCSSDAAWQSLQSCCQQNLSGACAGCCM